MVTITSCERSEHRESIDGHYLLDLLEERKCSMEKRGGVERSTMVRLRLFCWMIIRILYRSRYD